jgi:hypothetical protein
VLREHQNRKHAGLTQEAQQLVHLQNQEAAIRHRIQVTIETVDDDNARAM